MKIKKEYFLFLVTAPGALLFSVLNPSLAIVFIVPCVWYGARLFPSKGKKWPLSYLLGFGAGAVAILITVVRVLLYNIGS